MPRHLGVAVALTLGNERVSGDALALRHSFHRSLESPTSASLASVFARSLLTRKTSSKLGQPSFCQLSAEISEEQSTSIASREQIRDFLRPVHAYLQTQLGRGAARAIRGTDMRFAKFGMAPQASLHVTCAVWVIHVQLNHW